MVPRQKLAGERQGLILLVDHGGDATAVGENDLLGLGGSCDREEGGAGEKGGQTGQAHGGPYFRRGL